MKHSKLLLALVLAISLSPCAKANVVSLGTFSDTTFLLGLVGSGSFMDSYSFNLTGPTNITDAFAPEIGISDFGFTLKDVSDNTSLGSAPSYSNLGSGLYNFVFTGNVSTPIPFGIYFGDYHVSAAVPELDTWMMLLIGAGLLVYQLRRRQKALRPSQLAGT